MNHHERCGGFHGAASMKNLSILKEDEWLEADGLGGFASGTVAGIRTRR